MTRESVAALVLLLMVCLPLTAGQPELPDDSVYQLGGSWTKHNGQQLELAELAGRPRLVSFVYTYCEHTCPTIVARLKLATDGLEGSIADDLQITLVSLDPQRDTPQRLQTYMQEQGLDERGWLMLHGDPDEVLGFAAMLGVRYRPMGERDIAHSNMMTLLDGAGVVRYQSKGLGDDPADLAEAISQLASEEQ